MKIKNIKVKNFRTFKEFEHSFNERANIIYGENGSGKTTLIDIFGFFIKVLKTKEMIEVYAKNALSLFEGQLNKDSISISNPLNFYNDYASIDCKDNIVVELEAFVNKFDFLYRIEINCYNEIEEEILEIKEKSKPGVRSKVFSRKEDYFNDKYIDKSIYQRYESIFDKAGSVSHLSSLNYIYSVTKSTSDTQLLISDLYNSIIYLGPFSNASSNVKARKANPLTHLVHISKKSMTDYNTLLREYEKSVADFSSFVSEIDSAIIGCDYIKIEKDDYDEFVLCNKKKLGDKIVSIPYRQESTGTQYYLIIYDMICGITENESSLIVTDEFGIHLHQTLATSCMKYIIRNLDKNDSQLVFTTHLADLLNIDELKNTEKQIMTVSPFNGDRKIHSLAGVDSKENKARKFLSGKYGGSPSVSDIMYGKRYE